MYFCVQGVTGFDSLVLTLPAVLIVTILLLGLERLLRSRSVPALGATLPLPGTRISNLDGLRAFLALGVVFSHLVSFREYYFRAKPWDWPNNVYFRHSGEGSVLIFFMITGFLFWRKAIAGRGHLDPLKLYVNRIRRIYPLYLCLWATTLVIVVFRGGLQLHESAGKIAQEVAGFLLPGWWSWGPINNVERGYFAMQTWSLQYEIYFYLALPLLAIFARSAKAFVTLCGLFGLWLLLGHWPLAASPAPLIIPFLVGMLGAHLTSLTSFAEWTRGRSVALFIIGAAILVPMLALGATGRVGLAIYSLVFLVMVLGNDLFGLLNLRSAAFLGDASYSIYLMHPPVLFLYLSMVNCVWPIGSMPTASFWCVGGIGIVVVVAVAQLTFITIERPFIRHRVPAVR